MSQKLISGTIKTFYLELNTMPIQTNIYKFTKANNDLGTILVSPNESLIDSDRFADKMFNITKSQGNKRLEADILVANYFQDLNEILVGDRFWYENKLYNVIERRKRVL